MVFIIAEVGVNWNNSMTMAQDLIEAAVKAGADAVKFQFYNATQLLGPGGDAPAAPEIFEQVTWMDDVGWKDACRLKAICDDYGVEFFASAFDMERLDWLEKLGVKRHKLASRSVKFQPEYCNTVLNLGKSVIASLGMWNYGPRGTERPFPAERDQLHLGGGAQEVSYLYCVAEYPAPLEHVHLPYFGSGQSHRGYSDHTEGISAALMAVARGATIIEKHFTLDRDAPGPDHICSATPAQFALMVTLIRDMEKMQ